MNTAIKTYIDDCRAASCACTNAADCIQALAPLMLNLLKHSDDFLDHNHRRSDANGYTRNLIHASPDGDCSLYALVWQPGQWTPIHDHGSWGVVGVVEGVLEERNYVRTDTLNDSDDGIELARGSVILLTPGTVTTFVPNPDHIHLTGVAEHREPVISLHLYGRQMSNFHVYDAEAGTRTLIEVAHNES